MFTLIGIGTGVAYIYSVIAVAAGLDVYFEAAAVITALVLLGQVLELRARSRTGAAIRALLNLAPQDGENSRGEWFGTGRPARSSSRW